MVKRKLKKRRKLNTKSQDKALLALKKRNDKLEQMHDKQIRELDKQHEKSRRLMEYQHEQNIKTLKEQYEKEIKSIQDETENKAEVKAKLNELQKELEGRLRDAENDYEANLQELSESRRREQELKENNDELQREYNEVKQDYVATRETLQRSNEMNEEQKVELDRTKTRLNELKREYQGNIRDLKNALQVSQDHLQASYEMMSKIRDEKEQLKDDYADIQDDIADHKQKLKQCGTERKKLSKQVKMHKMDATDYNTRLQQIREREKGHKVQIANKTAQLKEKKQSEQQCKAAIRQIQAELDREKFKHLGLRADYEDRANRLAALNEALDACQRKNVDTQEVMRNMSDRYNALKKKTEAMMKEMRKLVDEKEMHREALRKEKVRSKTINENLQQSRQEMESKLRESDANHLQTYKLLDTCQKKNNACLANTKTRQEYVDKLEREIKRSMKALQNRAEINRRSRQLEEKIQVKDEELLALQKKLKELKQQNDDLKAEVKSFDVTRQMTNQMLVAHKSLKERHKQALKWIEEMKGHHQALHEKEVKIGKQLDKTNKNLNISESNMQRAAAKIRQLEEKRKETELEIRKCLYPGEKERLENQLLTVVKDRDALRSKMDQMITEHDGMYRKVKLLAEENKNLIALKERYEMDVEQMRKITEQGAELNLQLVKSEKLLKKKDKQLDLLSSQLGALIRRVKILEEREERLKQQLSASANPEEMELLEEKLILCRNETKDHIIKLQEVRQVAKHMTEQNKVHKKKVEALLEVIKDNEAVKDQLQKERMVRVQAEQAFRDCQTEQQINSEERKRRFLEMNNQYETNAQQHLEMMRESKARIADLQSQLERAKAMQRNAQLKARLHTSDTVYMPDEMKEPMTVNENIRQLENSTNRITNLTRGELVRLQNRAQESNDFRDAAIASQNLNSLKQLQQLRMAHQKVMREKEQEIMNIRKQTYDQLLDTLNEANSNAENVNTNELYRQIKDIRQRNAQREQASMSDMLRLRAINEKLSNEYKQARVAQWNLMHRANVQQRSKILQESALGPSNPDLYNEVQRYQNLVQSQKQYLNDQRDDVMNDLRNQRQYIYELQTQLPKMQAIENSINAQRFPELKTLQDQIQQERRYTIGALPNEKKEESGMSRSTSALEAQLRALNASVNSLTQSARQAAETKSNTNTDQLRRLASLSPGQIEEELRRQEAMGDDSALRTTFVIHPRTEQMGPPGRRLAADTSTGEVQVRGVKKNEQPQRFFADDVSMYQSPQKTFAPTVARVKRTIESNGNLIAVTYAFQPDSLNESGNSIKYLVFLHALQQIWPQVQSLSADGKINIQLVKVLPGEVRIDMLNENNDLKNACTYNTCNASERSLSDVKTAINVVENIASQLNEVQANTGSHLILTLSVPNSAARIHICDVLYKNQVPDVDSIKLLDSSWITYLSDVLQMPNVKIDMFFNVLPGNTDDVNMDENNKRLLQVSERLQNFLSQVKRMGNETN